MFLENSKQNVNSFDKCNIYANCVIKNTYQKIYAVKGG